MSLRTHKLLLFLGLLAYWGIFRGEWILKAYPAPTANTPEQLILDAFIVLLGVGASAMPKLPREIMRSYRLLPAFVAFVSSVASFVLTRIPEQPVATAVAPPFSAMACILLTTGWCVAYTRLRAHKVTESLPTLAVLSYIAMHVLVIPASVLGVDAVILPFVPLVSSILLAFALAPVVQTTDRGPDAPDAIGRGARVATRAHASDGAPHLDRRDRGSLRLPRRDLHGRIQPLCKHGADACRPDSGDRPRRRRRRSLREQGSVAACPALAGRPRGVLPSMLHRRLRGREQGRPRLGRHHGR